MKPTLLFFLKIFVYAAVTYGGTQFLVYYFFDDNQNLLRPLISGLGFGLIIGLAFTYKQVREVKKLKGKDFTSEDLSLHQAAHFQTPLTKAQILEKLQTNYPAKDWKMTEEADLISLKTTYSWKSFGEKVRIKTEQLQNGLSEVFIESKPRTWLTVADYGKNLENITYLRKLLSGR
ncbi:MAG TPA: hypothetical protein VK927_03260 [Adhaeribacter sp.]|nr:hypothetical protein [Adhaeribacter sp.]